MARPSYDSLQSRIKSNVTITESGCWEWNLSKDKDGYGRIKVNGKHKRVTRVVLSEFKGEDMGGKLACHTCDNPPCCNPDHLFPGTGSDNMADMVAKNRQVKPYKTHCIRNHRYTFENTSKSGNNRRCRECRKIRGN